MSAELVPLQGLTEVDVTALVDAVAGAEAAARWGGAVHRRSGGHPFFARELCRSLAAGDDPDSVPAAVRDVIRRRLDSVSDGVRVAGRRGRDRRLHPLPDVLALP